VDALEAGRDAWTRLPLEILEHGGGRVTSLAVLADGRLTSGGEYGRIKLWLVNTDRIAAALCLRTGRNLSRAEWDRYLGQDEPWQPSCRELPSHWRTPDDVALAKRP